MKFAVIVFPGSNCDHDAYHAAKHVLRQDAELIWHKDSSLKDADAVILPGVWLGRDSFITIGSVVKSGRYEENSLLSGSPAVRAAARFRSKPSGVAAQNTP